MTFKVGDRVERINYDNTSEFRVGDKGTVVNPDLSLACVREEGYIAVQPDNVSVIQYNDPKNLNLIEEKKDMKYKVGDRVEYVGNTVGVGQSKERIGSFGTVILVDAYGYVAKVEWDDRRTLAANPHKENIRLVVAPSKDEVEKALALLKAAGEVTFKPRKPAFIPINLGSVGGYTITVTDEVLKVGCTLVPFNKAEEIWNAIQKAKAYNAEN